MKSGSRSKRTATSLAVFGLAAPAVFAGLAGAVASSDTLVTFDTASLGLGDTGGDTAVAADGTIYIADAENHRIRQIATDGTITTIAGAGTAGLSGDGGQATDAELNAPQGIIVDGNGDLIIADTENSVIRKIDMTTGVITTIAGDGTASFGGDGTLATSAQINKPEDIAIDADGDLIIADSANARIREVNDGTGIITTIAGDDDGVRYTDADNADPLLAGLINPSGLAINGTDIYFADKDANKVRLLNGSGVTAFAGSGTTIYDAGDEGGAATSGELASPDDVAIDGAGNIYITSSANSRVHVVVGGNMSTLVGGGANTSTLTTGAAAQLKVPVGITVDSNGNVLFLEKSFVASTDAGSLRRLLEAETDDPTITINAPTNGLEITQGDEVAVNFECADASAGIKSCSATFNGVAIADGANLDSLSVGSFDLVVTAVDHLNNTDATTVSVTVVAAPAIVDNRHIVGDYAGVSGDSAVLARFYVAYLDRYPDTPGHEYWMSEIANGRSFNSVAAFFIESPEFKIIYGGNISDDEFVDLLYLNVMNRNAALDPVGRAYWNAQLDSGDWTRFEIAVYFAQSVEFKTATGTS